MTDSMMNVYKFWSDSLAGKQPPIINEFPEAGFYRMKRNGSWTPVAVWPASENNLGFKFGREVVDIDIGTERWPSYAANPITEDEYRRVAEQGLNWSDADPTVAAMTSTPKPIVTDSTDEMREQIATAVAVIPAYAKIESDEASARAAGLRNMLLGLKNQADKARVAEKDPHLTAAKAVDSKWMPLVREAESGANRVRTALEAWENDKRAAARQAAERAAAKQRRLDEEASRRDISEPPPEPVKPTSNLPPPSAQVKPTFGKAAGVSTYQHVTSIDAYQAFQMFQNHPDVIALLTKLAQASINAGISVPGMTTEERAKIR